MKCFKTEKLPFEKEGPKKVLNTNKYIKVWYEHCLSTKIQNILKGN